MSENAQEWASTADLAQAAKVHPATITRWVKLGILPQPRLVNMGRWGRQTRFPKSAIDQAAWVRRQLESGRTFEEIRTSLAAGDFRPSPEGEGS